MLKYAAKIINNVVNNIMMNKTILCSLMVATTLVSGCDYFKNKKSEPVEEKVETSNWSCTDAKNIGQVEAYLKAEYLKQLDKQLRHSSYEADQELLKKITQNVKFKIKNVTTITDDPSTAKNLACSSDLVVQLPKGLQKRAENAYLEAPCEECEGEEHASTLNLRDYLESGESNLTLGDDQLSGAYSYDITKTDKEGLTISAENQNAVIDGIVFVTVKAVQYESYVKQNSENREYSEKYSQEQAAEVALAQKVMDIRQKELDADKTKVVERLNQIWDQFSPEQKQQLQQDQSDWFEKRDVDCKVIAQKNVYQLADNDKEIYQKKSDYWDDAMRQQNEAMQYTKCFNQKTTERIIYLNNIFN